MTIPNILSRLRRTRLRAEQPHGPSRWIPWLCCPRTKPHIVFKETA